MKKHPPAPATPKRGRGRPRIDPDGPQRPISVKLAPGEREHLLAKFGSISGGVRALVVADMLSKR